MIVLGQPANKTLQQTQRRLGRCLGVFGATWARADAGVGRRAAERLEHFRVVVLAIAALHSGCIVYREPLATPPESRVLLAAPKLASVSLAVSRPKLNDPAPDRLAGLSPEDVLEFKRMDSERLIYELKSTGVFANVGYADELEDADSVLIEPVEGPPGRADGDAVLLVAFTAGLLPAVGEFQRGIYFRVSGVDRPPFRCDWPQSQVLGSIPTVLLWVSGPWSFHPDHDAFLYQLRKCLVEQTDRLLAVAQ